MTQSTDFSRDELSTTVNRHVLHAMFRKCLPCDIIVRTSSRRVRMTGRKNAKILCIRVDVDTRWTPMKKLHQVPINFNQHQEKSNMQIDFPILFGVGRVNWNETSLTWHHHHHHRANTQSLHAVSDSPVSRSFSSVPLLLSSSSRHYFHGVKNFNRKTEFF